MSIGLEDAALDATPLVIVEGFMSASGSIGWAPLRSLLSGFEEYLDGRRVLYARFVAHRVRHQHDSHQTFLFYSVGPVSSLHDRACELFYAIKGGTGMQHSEHDFTYH